MNRKGQALIEALVAGTLCLISLYYVLIYGIKIIQSAIREEKLEEQYIRTQKL